MTFGVLGLVVLMGIMTLAMTPSVEGFILEELEIFATLFAPDVHIFPADPVYNSVLRCDVDYEMHNLAYRIDTKTYAFYRDNILVRGFIADDKYVCDGLCAEGSTWHCVARLSEGQGVLSQTRSQNEIIIGNSPPIITATISPEFPTDTQPIFCEIDVTDPDGDGVVVNSRGYTWSKRQSSLGQWIVQPGLDRWGVSEELLEPGWEWKCSIDARDYDNAVATATAVTYIHHVDDLPSSITGNPVQTADLKWFVDFGEVRSEPLHYGGNPGDELGFPIMSRLGEYMLVLNDRCVGGQCGSSQAALRYGSPSPYAGHLIPVVPFNRGEYASFTVNPQRTTQSYPQVYQVIPDLYAWNYWDEVNCLADRKYIYSNERCPVPYVLDQKADNTTNILVSNNCFDPSSPFSNDVRCNDGSISLAVQPITPYCERFSELVLLPRDHITTVGDTIIYLAYARNHITGEWIDVTHQIDVITSHPDIAVVNTVMDWDVYAAQSTQNLAQGAVAVTATFCGLQDITTLTIRPNMCSDISEVTVSPQIIQEPAGTEGTIGASITDQFGQPVALDIMSGLDTSSFDQNVILVGDENGYTNPLDYLIADCAPGERCGTHVRVQVNTPNCVEPFRRTVAVRTLQEICTHYRKCSLTEDAQAWIASELRQMYRGGAMMTPGRPDDAGQNDGSYEGYYAETEDTELLAYIGQVLANRLEDLRTNYEYSFDGPQYSIPVVDLFCPVRVMTVGQPLPPGMPSWCLGAIFVDFPYPELRSLDEHHPEYTLAVNQLVDVLLARPGLVAFFPQGFGGSDDPATHFMIRYQACSSDENDRMTSALACNSCIHEGQLYPDGALLDVDGDGFMEICQTASPGEWGDPGVPLGRCDLNAVEPRYQQCSEAGFSYQPDESKIYVPSPENFGFWCVYNASLGNFNWIKGVKGGIDLEQIQDVVPAETCTDGYDSNCNMYDKFTYDALLGHIDTEHYIESSTTYFVEQHPHNLDKFDNACWASLTVSLTDVGTGLPVADADVTVSFRAGLTETLYRQDVTGVAGTVGFGSLPATRYVITATKNGCSQAQQIVTMDVLTDYVVDLDMICGGFCGDGIVQSDLGEQCDGAGPYICPAGFSSTNAVCNSCMLEGCEPIVQPSNVVQCPDGKKLVIVRRPVIDPLTGGSLTMAIAVCEPYE